MMAKVMMMMMWRDDDDNDNDDDCHALILSPDHCVDE